MIFIFLLSFKLASQYPEAVRWHKYEIVFISSKDYENPVQDVRTMEVTFTSPAGKVKTINGLIL